ncbi:MAG: hypothetical protein JKY54_18625 [Flavobacteriales bacterium]|nr:hypothetical protein [Flavobacteriales bacterium]
MSLPSKHVHEDGGCNEDMMQALDEYLVTELSESSEEEDSEIGPDSDQSEEEDSNEIDVDPRWEALNKLKKGKLK